MLLLWWSILQICLESLPISSSGHTSLFLSYWDMSHESLTVQDLSHFDWALHSITLLVMLIYFWSAWWHLILHRRFSFVLLSTSKFWYDFWRAFIFVTIVALSFIILYATMHQLHIFEYVHVPLWVGFFITALQLYYINISIKSSKFVSVQWNKKHAVILGIINAAAVLVPGVSRFASNLLGCMLLGYAPRDAFSLSWMVFLPFTLAGSVYGIMQVLKNEVLLQQVLHINLLLVMVGAGLISYILLYGMEYVISRRKLSYLAWYMLLPLILSIGR